MIKSFNNYLYFPKLKHEKQVTNFKKATRTGSEKHTSLFSLDWSQKETHCRESHEKWMRDCHSDKNIPYVEDLPDKWDDYLKTKIFAIPVKYLYEIRYQSLQALTEWNRSPLPFDTMIRDICISPARGHITAAFKLIKDCAYDLETNYYSRDIADVVLSHTMIYKFWSGQTGRGLLWRNADLDSFKWAENTTEDNQRAEKAKEFLSDMKIHEEFREKQYEPLSADIVESPDIEN